MSETLNDYVRRNVVKANSNIQDVVQILEDADVKTVFVIDTFGKPIGSVTDGDVRRGILKGIPLTEDVSKVMNRNPRLLTLGAKKSEIAKTMRDNRIAHVGLVNASNVLVDIQPRVSDHSFANVDNSVVIMAGGKGQRLRPLTDKCPKPMLHVGGRPLLETTMQRLSSQGFKKFYVSLNYMGDYIEKHFGDGSNMDISISYLRENDELGTAGALGRLSPPTTLPLVVVNGDVLTNLDYRKVLDFHLSQSSAATMVVREYETQVPYGVVETENLNIVRLREKPVYRYFVNAGVYVLDPSVVSLLPVDKFYDMPGLFNLAKNEGYTTLAYPCSDYWIDIGHVDDLDRANFEFDRIF